MNFIFSSSEGTFLHVVKSLYDKMYFEQGSAVISIWLTSTLFVQSFFFTNDECNHIFKHKGASTIHRYTEYDRQKDKHTYIHAWTHTSKHHNINILIPVFLYDDHCIYICLGKNASKWEVIKKGKDKFEIHSDKESSLT